MDNFTLAVVIGDVERQLLDPAVTHVGVDDLIGVAHLDDAALVQPQRTRCE